MTVNLQHVTVMDSINVDTKIKKKYKNLPFYPVQLGTGAHLRFFLLPDTLFIGIASPFLPSTAIDFSGKTELTPFLFFFSIPAIPVRFQKPLRDLRCHEEEDVVFECVLRTPCYDAVWLHKAHPLEASEKHQISVSPDGMTHQLIIKNAVTSDNGLYTLDTGLCSSRAWLLVERK